MLTRFFMEVKMIKDKNSKNLGRVYEVEDVIRRKEFESDLKEVEIQLSVNKNEIALYLTKALLEMMLGLAEKSIESVKQALLLDETALFGWYLLGCGYFETGRYVQAKDSYEKALTLEIDPKYKFPYDSVIKDILGKLQYLSSIKLNEEEK
jgi:tetratricopeptide (TPR) repeat protein